MPCRSHRHPNWDGQNYHENMLLSIHGRKRLNMYWHNYDGEPPEEGSMKGAFSSVIVLLFFPFAIAATPFDNCPSNAFLIQGNPASYWRQFGLRHIYNIAIGSGTAERFNAGGFSVHDRFIYGWNYATSKLARFGKDYTVQDFDVSGLPSGNFFVGDVAVQENAFYLYRRGLGGLYRISLDPTTSDYLVATQVTSGGAMFLRIADFAFHPSQNLYTALILMVNYTRLMQRLVHWFTSAIQVMSVLLVLFTLMAKGTIH